jgi:hypothetical protein
MRRRWRDRRPGSASAVVRLRRCVRSGSLSLAIATVVLSPPLHTVGVLGAPLPIAAAGFGSPSLSILGILALALAIPAILRALLVPVLPLPTKVILGQPLGVLLVPLAHTRLALRIATVPPRAVAAELRQRLLLPAPFAALQVIRGRRGSQSSPSRSFQWACHAYCALETLCAPAYGPGAARLHG